MGILLGLTLVVSGLAAALLAPFGVGFGLVLGVWGVRVLFNEAS